jgi:hypothetical protein
MADALGIAAIAPPPPAGPRPPAQIHHSDRGPAHPPIVGRTLVASGLVDSMDRARRACLRLPPQAARAPIAADASRTHLGEPRSKSSRSLLSWVAGPRGTPGAGPGP